MKSFFLAWALSPLASAIWPLPTKYTSGNTTFWIEPECQVNLNGASKNTLQSANVTGLSYNSTPQSSQIIDAAIDKTYRTLFKHNFVPWKFHPRNSEFEPPPTNKNTIQSIDLVQTGTDPENLMKAAAGEIDESYTLAITQEGRAQVHAATSIGIARGLTTFTQLFYEHTQGGVYTPYAPVVIEDAPKFPHRGINMDLSRNWFCVRDVKKMIDAMAFNKFNRFHLHITDAQSWPLEIPALPELAAKGAYRKDLTYSPEDLAEIQQYGAFHGIQVFLETDMPGHTSSIWYSHPDLIASFNQQPNWNDFAAEPPSGTLKLNSTKVYDFLETMFNDLLPRVAPYTTYYHTGGDEVNKNAYLNDETVQSSQLEVLQPLMQKFIDTLHTHVRDAGLTPIVWEEMVLNAPTGWNLTVGDDVIVQAWQSSDAILESVSKGFKTLTGTYEYWYLDCGQGQWLNFYPNSSQSFFPFADYCSPRKNWRLMYAYDPLWQVPEEKQHLILGGEAHIWAEQTDPVNLDRMVWPRACAAAEVLWSGPKDEDGNSRSQVDAAPRLSEMRERLVARGVAAEPVQMIFCLMEPGQCNL